MMKTNSFENDIQVHSNIYTTFLNKELILCDVDFYQGPLTMQYLPFGGIQSTYNYHLIIHVKNGYIYPKTIIYNNIVYTPKEFITKFNNLVNQVLPN